MPPVGAYVRALSVISDRMTASRYGPRYVHAAAQPDQNTLVCSSASSALMHGSGARCDCFQVSTNH